MNRLTLDTGETSTVQVVTCLPLGSERQAKGDDLFGNYQTSSKKVECPICASEKERWVVTTLCGLPVTQPSFCD